MRSESRPRGGGKIDLEKKVTLKKGGKKALEEEIVEKVAEAPARVLDGTIEISKKVEKSIVEHEPIKAVKDYWKTLGPGLTTGASDDDPSGIATYSQTGAGWGFRFLWLAAFTYPLMSNIQEMCARIGLVTGRGLAGNIRKFFPRWILILCTLLLFIANTFNIGANLGAISEAIRLFYPQLGYFKLIFAVVAIILLCQIFLPYRKYANYLKWLALILISYIFSTLLIDGLDWQKILFAAITPSFSFTKDQIVIVTAILGTTISPYLFFWQTSQEVEDGVEDGITKMEPRQREIDKKEIKKMRIDVWSGMFLSNLVMFFIIAACAATLHAHGITNIETAADAALALRPLAGEYSFLLFAIGIIGTGALGIPILAGASSYALAESFGWRYGLHYKLRQAYAFYGVIIISIVVGALINLIGINPIKALIYAAVLNGFVAPVVLVLILILASSAKLMGEKKNGWLATAIGWITAGLMAFAGLATIWSLMT